MIVSTKLHKILEWLHDAIAQITRALRTFDEEANSLTHLSDSDDELLLLPLLLDPFSELLLSSFSYKETMKKVLLIAQQPLDEHWESLKLKSRYWNKNSKKLFGCLLNSELIWL